MPDMPNPTLHKSEKNIDIARDVFEELEARSVDASIEEVETLVEGVEGLAGSMEASEAWDEELPYNRVLYSQAISDIVWRNSLPDFEPNPKAVDNPKIRVGYREGIGRIVLAKEPIKAGEVIATFDGPVFEAEKITDLPNQYLIDHVIQVSPTKYMMEARGVAAILAHSCEPNCGIKGNPPKIIAMQDVAAGEELTWDYAMSEDSNWEMGSECKCGSENCRKTITSFSDLPNDKRNEYMERGGYISPWILEKHSTIRTLRGSEVTPEVLEKLANILREIFCNEWKEYAFCPCCDPKLPHGKRVSAQEVYKKKYVPLKEMDDNPILPICDEEGCGTQMQLFLPPQGTLDCLANKFKRRAWLTFLEDWNGDVVGFSYGHEGDLREIFAREWEKFYSYAEDAPDDKRDWSNFHVRVSEAVAEHYPAFAPAAGELLMPDSPMIALNCVGIKKQFRGLGNFYKIAMEICGEIARDAGVDALTMGESVLGTQANALFRAAGAVEIEGVTKDVDLPLENGDDVLVLISLRQYLEKYCKMMEKYVNR